MSQNQLNKFGFIYISNTNRVLYWDQSPIEVLDKLHDTISDIRNSYPTAKLFLGRDFNSSGIDWHHKK